MKDYSQMIQEAGVLFSNLRYDPAHYYFLYIGELKAYGINHFVEDWLRKEHPGKEVRCIAIVPDICSHYAYEDILVINPLCATAGSGQDSAGSPLPVACRPPAAAFMAAVSSNEAVHRLIARVLVNQEELYLSMFESVAEMTLDSVDGVVLLGPDKATARHYNSKTVQFRELAGHVPLVPGEICRGLRALEERTEALRHSWPEGIFVSAAYSAAGANSAITHNLQDVLEKFTDPEGEYVITRYLPHQLDPTVLAVVANGDDVYVAGVADQHIVDGNKFVGSSFPSRVSEGQAAQLHAHTVAAGRLLGRAGYRGIFGCDYLVDNHGGIWFLEINARKQGTTFEFCCTLEHNLPSGAANLLELEYHAVRYSRFPAHTVAVTGNVAGLHWRTYNHKTSAVVDTTVAIPQHTGERRAFAGVARRETARETLILEHLGAPLRVLPGTFLARAVCVGLAAEDVDAGLAGAVASIHQSYHRA